MATGSKKKFLLIGWDGADWQHIDPLLEQGLLPNLDRLINEGCMGNLASLQPMLSPMLWNSAATGKYAYKHGIHGFIEPDPFNGGARPFSSYSRKCKALWNIFSQEGLKSNVINWWASHPADKINGCVVSNLIGGVKFGSEGPTVGPGTIHPKEKAQRYAVNKVLPQELGSEQICPFIPKAAEIDQDNDSRIEQFAKTFAEMLTTHAVATDVMENEPWDFMAIYYTAIDHFAHGYMPYHPPKMDRVSESDFEIFKDVVVGAYRFSDMMLGRLLQLAGDDCYVLLCSDHGFHSGATRPNSQPREPAGPAIWHRQYGIFVMKGPDIKQDERIYGASLIDIAPTVLTTMGKPIGADMDGRPLLEVFKKQPRVQVIPSWEDVDGPFNDGMHGKEQPQEPQDAEELLKQFVALGYVEDPGDDKEKRAANADIECQYNLARNYVFVGQYDNAIPLMEGLVRRSPWESRFISQLVHCYQRAGYYRQALNVLESAYDVETTSSMQIKIAWVGLKIDLGEEGDELTGMLAEAEASPLAIPSILTQIGRSHIRLERWRDAERAYRKCVELHPQNELSWLGLSRVYRELGEYEKTVDSALNAVSLVHRLPHAHLNLGIALAELGQTERAIFALSTALKFSDKFVLAHRWLAKVYEEQVKDHSLAERYHRLADGFEAEQRERRQKLPDRAEQVFEICPIPSEDERLRRLLEERPDRTDPRAASGKSFVLVSGLPRSGTSLMMQMLEAGGLPAKTSDDRPADENNPKGYFEWEAIKKIATRPHVLLEEGLEDHAIKCISALLEFMPYAHNYKIIFMTRPIEEVAQSQMRMIDRLGTDGSSQTFEEITEELSRHRTYIRERMEQNPRSEVLEIDYPTLVTTPTEIIPLISDFLGQRLPYPEKMIEVIDSSLYRQRQA